MKSSSNVMPVLFLGHGSPMCVITDNPYRQAWIKIGKTLPKPSAILCISAHWESADMEVATTDSPATIYDFYGFPEALYAIKYPVAGAPALIDKVRAHWELADGSKTTTPIIANPYQGLDHGAWAVLMSLFPNADIPVAQMSLSRNLSVEAHNQVAQSLGALRDEGILVVASGNITHNLRLLDARPQAPAMAWAKDFDQTIAQALINQDTDTLIHYHTQPSAKLAVPTREHYLPLLYPAAMRRKKDTLKFFAEGFDMGSISMRSFILSED